MKHNPLTREQRYQIAALLKAGLNQTQIAGILGKHKSVICRELQRNRTKRGIYNPETAHLYTIERRERLPHACRFTPDIRAHVLHCLTVEQWSPEQIVGEARRAGRPMVSHETIYKLIRADRAAGGTLFHHTRHRLKHRRRSSGSRPRTIIRNRRSIDDRPAIVDQRARFGDWEIDTIVGAGNRGAILTMVERLTGFIFIEPLPRGKNAEALADVVIRVLLPYKHHIHTITSDNGTEFAAHERIARRLGIDYYFAHPYASYERGSIENANALIRQYLLKSTDLTRYTPLEIKQVQKKINKRPRKRLQFSSPIHLFSSSLSPSSCIQNLNLHINFEIIDYTIFPETNSLCR